MIHENSNIIQQFMNPIVEKIHHKKPFLSKMSQLCIEKITTWIKDSEKSFENTEIKETILDKKGELPKGKYYYHIPYKIKHYIENNDWVGKQYSFSIQNRVFTIHCIYPTNNIQQENEIIEWFDMIKKQIYSWLFIACSQSNEECSKDVSIYLYFTDFKKQFPHKKEILGENHVNSAYTFSCKLNKNGNNEMYLYRKEEWFKVFIHECFHAFSLDFSHMDTRKIDKELTRIFPLHLDVRFFETYSETWAEILNVIYYVYYHENMKLSKIMECLKIEQVHSLFQMVKILKYNEISYNELYENSEKAKTKRIHNYKEYTPIFSYYILKCICMMNVGEFIEWSYVGNKGSLNINKNPLITTETNMNLFVDFIKKRYNHVVFLNFVKEMEHYHYVVSNNYKHLKKNTKTSEKIYFLLKNLRMSVFEKAS
jgi:hypothetical protein